MIGKTVWIPSDQFVWKTGNVINDDSTSKCYSVKSDDEDTVLSVSYKDTWEVDSSHRDYSSENVCSIQRIHEAPLFDCLKQRFLCGNVYTFAADVLISFNPYKNISAHYGGPCDYLNKRTNKDSRPYGDGKQQKPHAYAIANNALQAMLNPDDSGIFNQSVLISGESGSGKTETSKFVLDFLIQANIALNADGEDAHGQSANHRKISTGHFVLSPITKAVQSEDVKTMLIKSSIIFESVGNAKTVRNDNSSRFGKYMKLEFSRKNQLVSSFTQTFLLEQARIVALGEGERNYHVFYRMVRGLQHADAPTASRLHLRSIDDFNILTEGKCTIITTASDDVVEYFILVEALSAIGCSSEEIGTLWDLLASLLHLGNVTFVADSDLEERPVKVVCPLMELSGIAGIVGVEEFLFLQSLTIQKVKVPNRASIHFKNLTPESAKNNSFAMIKWIYRCLFSWLVRKANYAYSTVAFESEHDNEVAKFIGILDIFGFEILGRNSLEQFFINFTNERLQQQFNEHVFLLELQEYREEEVQFPFFTQCDNQHVIDMINRKRTGLFAILEEHSVLNANRQPDDEKLLQSFDAAHHGKSSSYEKGRFGRDGFAIKHFAGSVSYSIAGFLARNNDSLQDDLAELMSTSTSTLLQSAMGLHRRVCPGDVGYIPHSTRDENGIPDDIRAAAVKLGGSDPVQGGAEDRAGGVAGARFGRQSFVALTPGKSAAASNRETSKAFATVSYRFRTQLDSLMKTLQTTKFHNIKCIKPNGTKSPHEFDAPLVMQQIKYSGILELVRIKQEGYSMRMPFRYFYSRFSALGHSQGWAAERACTDLQAKEYCSHIANTYLEPTRQPFQIGKTKVYMMEECLPPLQQANDKIILTCILLLSRFLRMSFARKKFLRYRHALIELQKLARGKYCRSIYKEVRKVKRQILLAELAREARARDRERKAMAAADLEARRSRHFEAKEKRRLLSMGSLAMAVKREQEAQLALSSLRSPSGGMPLSPNSEVQAEELAVAIAAAKEEAERLAEEARQALLATIAKSVEENELSFVFDTLERVECEVRMEKLKKSSARRALVSAMLNIESGVDPCAERPRRRLVYDVEEEEEVEEGERKLSLLTVGSVNATPAAAAASMGMDGTRSTSTSFWTPQLMYDEANNDSMDMSSFFIDTYTHGKDNKSTAGANAETPLFEKGREDRLTLLSTVRLLETQPEQSKNTSAGGSLPPDIVKSEDTNSSIISPHLKAKPWIESGSTAPRGIVPRGSGSIVAGESGPAVAGTELNTFDTSMTLVTPIPRRITGAHVNSAVFMSDSPTVGTVGIDPVHIDSAVPVAPPARPELTEDEAARKVASNLRVCLTHKKVSVRLEALHIACERGDVEAIATHQRSHPNDFLVPMRGKDIRYSFVYHAAIRGNQFEVLSNLALQPAHVLRCAADGNNLFHYASLHSASIEIFQLLADVVSPLKFNDVNTFDHEIWKGFDSGIRIKEGWLLKQMKWNLWRPRYVVLTPLELRYSGFLNITTPADVFPLNSEIAVFSHRYEIAGDILTIKYVKPTLKSHKKGNQSVTFKCTNPNALLEWTEALTTVIKMESFQSQDPPEFLPERNLPSLATVRNRAGDLPIHILARQTVCRQEPESDILNTAKTLSWFVDHGCQLDSRNLTGKTALLVAVENQNAAFADLVCRQAITLQDSADKGVFTDAIERFKENLFMLEGMHPSRKHLCAPLMRGGYTYLRIGLQHCGYPWPHIRAKSVLKASSSSSISRFSRKNISPSAASLTKAVEDGSGAFDDPLLPLLTVRVYDSNRCMIEPEQMIVCPLVSRAGFVWWGRTWYMQTPLELVPAGSYVLFELLNKSESKPIEVIGSAVFAIDHSLVDTEVLEVPVFIGKVKNKDWKSMIPLKATLQLHSMLARVSFSQDESTMTNFYVDKRKWFEMDNEVFRDLSSFERSSTPSSPPSSNARSTLNLTGPLEKGFLNSPQVHFSIVRGRAESRSSPDSDASKDEMKESEVSNVNYSSPSFSFSPSSHSTSTGSFFSAHRLPTFRSQSSGGDHSVRVLTNALQQSSSSGPSSGNVRLYGGDVASSPRRSPQSTRSVFSYSTPKAAGGVS